MTLDTQDKDWIRDTIIEALEAVVLPRFDEHDKRFDEHDKRFDALEADVRVLKEDMTGVKEDIRVIKEDVRVLKDDMGAVKSSLHRLEGRVEALEADIKEIYHMQARLERTFGANDEFAKLTLEKKLLQLHANLLATAKEAGITLPRQ